jgi:hypothetical protein
MLLLGAACSTCGPLTATGLWSNSEVRATQLQRCLQKTREVDDLISLDFFLYVQQPSVLVKTKLGTIRYTSVARPMHSRKGLATAGIAFSDGERHLICNSG